MSDLERGSSFGSVGLARRASPRLAAQPSLTAPILPELSTLSEHGRRRLADKSDRTAPAIASSPSRTLMATMLAALALVTLVATLAAHTASVPTLASTRARLTTTTATSAANSDRDSNSDAAAGPPYYDSLATIESCPALAPILAANGIPVTDATGALVNLSAPSVARFVDDYNTALHARLARTELSFVDWREEQAKPVTMATKLSEGAFVTNSTRNTRYSISTWENLCLSFGHPRDPHLVLVGNEPYHSQLITDSIIGQHRHGEPSWLPGRWHNDQGRIRAQDRPEPDWLFIPAVPSDGRGLIADTDESHTKEFLNLPAVQRRTSRPPASFHAFEWDFNVGHQFHQQVWPLYQALHSHDLLDSPLIQSLLIDNGCRDDSSTLGVRHGAWKPINQFFSRIVLSGTQQRVRMLRQDCSRSDSPQWPSGICFERVAFNDPSDQYLDKGPDNASFHAFRAFRALILHSLRFDPHAETTATERLRVTIYSRHDSSRRRIVNVDAIVAAFAPFHIVRHIPNFGVRPPAEQLALYANTDLLIAPHGAHMTFTFLLPKNAIVVECFAHAEGLFSWTVNFLRATDKRHIKQVGIARSEDVVIGGEFRHMDRDFEVNLTALCHQLKQWAIPIDYHC